jgi:hypothetical protein
LERCEQAQASAAEPANDVVPVNPKALPQEALGASELSSRDEQRKFQRLGPIDLREVRACDLDTLCQKLIGEL